ncbi:CRISPR-associated protein, Cas2 family [Clostridium sp. USBA 49]|uniref:CRISPR-associated endonuclease Cas2 n=1 Tax=Clostridium sp. USBA 49 TaxID=1881060 RepID=UPI00099903E2|nr:CRISPR-associated endonuclease Cas2 [Clostridium sp. USBA 49]SKA90371.1 CRISPR-associated protein, Cas2 family [Clostridium sp. USBA 49]
MLIWVVYDISDNKIRNKAVKACKNKGLYRVQKSVFLGTLNKNDKDELKMIMEDIIDKSTDSVYIFPSDKDFLKDTDLIGQGFDKELIADVIISKFI